eukprot:gene7416-15150_t
MTTLEEIIENIPSSGHRTGKGSGNKVDSFNEADEVNGNEIGNSKAICTICRGNLQNSFTLPCSHSFCSECLKQYVTSKICIGMVHLKCFQLIDENNINESLQSCANNIPENVIIQIIHDDANIEEKYHRFKLLKDNKNARSCPQCDVVSLGKEEDPAMICAKCGKQFCFLHSDAHAPGSDACKRYRISERSVEETLLSNEFINNTSKKCPGCGIGVMKAGGCNHIKCANCGVAFCWLCGTVVEDEVFPAHFQWWNPGGCTNLQMDEDQEPTTDSRRCALVTTILQLIFLGPLSLASTLISLLLCSPCLYLAVLLQQRTDVFQTAFSQLMSCWGLFWMFLLLGLPFFLSLFGIALGVTAVALVLCVPFLVALRLTGHHDTLQWDWRSIRANWLPAMSPTEPSVDKNSGVIEDGSLSASVNNKNNNSRAEVREVSGDFTNLFGGGGEQTSLGMTSNDRNTAGNNIIRSTESDLETGNSDRGVEVLDHHAVGTATTHTLPPIDIVKRVCREGRKEGSTSTENETDESDNLQMCQLTSQSLRCKYGELPDTHRTTHQLQKLNSTQKTEDKIRRKSRTDTHFK